MDNITLVTVGAAAIIVVILGTVYALYRKYANRDAFQAWIERIAPDEIQAIAVWASLKAYDAVAQIADQYGEMSDEDKQKLATKFVEAILDLLLRGQTSPEASRALLEANIRQSKHSEKSLAHRAGAPPLEAVMRRRFPQ